MFPKTKALFLLMLFCMLPVTVLAQDVRVMKKPKGFIKEYSSPTGSGLDSKQRVKWKKLLNWCEECDERASPYTESDNWESGLIYLYPMEDHEYIVNVVCYQTMRNSELLFYKVVEHEDTIEIRLLKMEQFDFIPAEGEDTGGVEEKPEPKGEFIRYTDTLVYGAPYTVEGNPKVICIEQVRRGTGGCGLWTTYDVSGDTARIVEFRAKNYCSGETTPLEQWPSYSAEQRAKWREVPFNPIREEWKTSPTPACLD